MGESRLVKFLSKIKLLVFYRKLLLTVNQEECHGMAEERQGSFPCNSFRRLGKEINVGKRNNILIIIPFEIIKFEGIGKFYYFSYSLCYPWVF